MATVKEIITTAEGKMHKSVDALRVDLASLRAGRATPSLLEKVTVDYYGSPTPVTQVASVSVPEPRMIVIQPWERNMIKEIEKAIMKSDLGLNPNSDGVCIRLNLPQLTEERRKELVKVVHKKAEDFRVVVAEVRRGVGQNSVAGAGSTAHIHRELALSFIDRRRDAVNGEGNDEPDEQKHEHRQPALGNDAHHSSERDGSHQRPVVLHAAATGAASVSASRAVIHRRSAAVSRIRRT